MAITPQMAQLILAEHIYRPITGQVLLLGKQTVFMTPDKAQQLMDNMGIKIRTDARIEYDNSTQGRQNNFISDVSFFSLFSDAIVKACDVSDYEKADYIFDLSTDLPTTLIEQFDFIYNGSVLDNIFDPAGAIKNISRLLKPNGVVFHYEGLKHAGMTYLKFTPEWFFDYYAINGFNDCQSYLLAYHDYFKPYSVLEWDAYNKQHTSWEAAPAIKLTGEAMVITIAERAFTSTTNQNPIQSTYNTEKSEYITAFNQFLTSKRRQSIRHTLSTLSAKETPIIKEDNKINNNLLTRWMKKKTTSQHMNSSINLPPYEHPTLCHTPIGTVHE